MQQHKKNVEIIKTRTDKAKQRIVENFDLF